MGCLVGIGFLGEGARKVMDYPCIRPPKRKLPENGSLHFFFVIKRGLGERVRAIDRGH